MLGCRWPGCKWIASWKNEATVFKFILLSWKTRYNFDYGLFFLVNSLDIFLLVFDQYFFVRKRYVDLIWGHFDPKAWKSPWRSPCKSSYFGKNDSFYQLFLKKNDFGQNTQLWVGFAKIKSFHSLNTQFWAVFEKKLDAIGNKTENSRVPSYRGSVTIFSVTLKSQKTFSYQWKPKNKGLLLFKIIQLVL